MRGGQIYTSTDSGVSWTARDANRSWQSAASSADGSRLVAVEFFGGRIHASSAWTTPGIGGSISGGPFDAIDLQYAGGGLFTVLSHEGNLSIQ